MLALWRLPDMLPRLPVRHAAVSRFLISAPAPWFPPPPHYLICAHVVHWTITVDGDIPSNAMYRSRMTLHKFARCLNRAPWPVRPLQGGVQLRPGHRAPITHADDDVMCLRLQAALT